MNGKVLILFFLILLSPLVTGQQLTESSFWKESPGFPVIENDFKDENVVGIFDKEKKEFYYNPEGELELLFTLHRRFRISNDESINMFNKISVSLNNVIEVVDIKARVIKPDGRVVEFDRNNIKEVKDEESRKNLQIFAVDGMEKGDDLEYLVLRKMNGSSFGQAVFQFDYPVQQASFELISPKNLLYDTKGYNGFPTAQHEELEDGRHRYFCSMEKIPELKERSYAYFMPNRMRLEYRLDYNLSRSQSQVLTWNDAAERVYEMMYHDVNPKQVEKWLKTIKVKKGDVFTQVAQIEEYLKSNIYVQEFDVPEFSDFDFILEKKVSGEQGIVRLFVNLLKALDIPHEIVLTSPRNEIRFDADFQSWNYLDKYLIYFPGPNVYLDPVERAYRLGLVDGEVTATQGLFIELVKFGDFESAVGKIKFIEPTPFNANYDNMNIEISVDVDNALTNVTNTRGFKGLSGGYFNLIFKALDDDQKQNMLKSLMETKAPNPVYNDLKVVEKSDVDFINNADFIIYSDFRSSSFIEIAGNKLLLNMGESIGPQAELYYEEERTDGGEYGFNRWYFRKIKVNVPEGYRIVNPEVADMNIIEKDGDDPVFGFISTHTYEGNVYTVTIDEYYKRIFITPDQFEGFRDVVNGAANFNKVVLVLEKIQ